MNKRPATENWCQFLNETSGETSLSIVRTQEALIENLEEVICDHKNQNRFFAKISKT